jgi:hypothetical protein
MYNDADTKNIGLSTKHLALRGRIHSTLGVERSNRE